MSTSNKRLSILCLTTSVGEQSCPYNELSLPLRHRHDITICAYFKAQVTPPKEITLLEGDGTLRCYFRLLKTAFAEKEYDIVHAHTPHVAVFFLLANILRGRLGRRGVCTVHNSYENFKLRNKLLFLPVFSFFPRIVYCGHESRESFPLLYRWLAGKRHRAVPNGVNLHRIDDVLEHPPQNSSNGHFTVASVGKLIDIKNPSCVLSAFGLSGDSTSRLEFLGDGPLRVKIQEELVADDLRSRVAIDGAIPREEVYRHLRRADLFISTSFGEGLPVAVLEAMACRCPVVLSDIGPHREIAEGTDFIPLIPPRDVAGFAREIKRFREMSLQQRADIGEQCRALVGERFSLNAMHRGYEEVYRQLIDGAYAN